MTKANRKKRNKGGRPRLENVEREPNGRPLRSQRKTETETEVRKVAVQARARIYGAPEAECVRPEYGSVLGRLYLSKQIRKHHFDAGNRMAEDYARYFSLTGIPHPSARAQDISRVKGLGSDPNPIKVRAAANKVMAIEMMLGGIDVQSRPVTSVCKRVCIMDEGNGIEYPHMVKLLVKGLEALVVLYGIEMREAA